MSSTDKGYKAEKSDYVLAKGPDGKRVWIHKATGEIRTTLPTGPDGSGAAAAPAAASAPAAAAPAFAAPAAASAPAAAAPAFAVGSGNQPADVKTTMKASVDDLEAMLKQDLEFGMSIISGGGSSSQGASPPGLAAPKPGGITIRQPGGIQIRQPGLAAKAAAVSRSSGAVVGGATPPPSFESISNMVAMSNAILSGNVDPNTVSSLSDDTSLKANGEGAAVSDTLAQIEKVGGLLADVNFEVVPANELVGDDYELLAGRSTVQDYNDSLKKYAIQKAEQAAVDQAAAAAAAAAHAALAVPPPPQDGLGDQDPGAFMQAMAAYMTGTENADGAGNADPTGVGMEQAAVMMQMMSHMKQQLGVTENGDALVDPESQAGMDVAMAAQLMQLNRFHLQQRVFETQKSIASGDMATRFKEGFRPMQLCKQFLKSGSCVRGDTCSYAHTFEELHPMSPAVPGAASAQAVEALAEVQKVDEIEPSMRMQRKRAMCQRLTRGQCQLGGKCPFAHHEDELGTVALAITDRVKTSICKFYEQQKCVYGKYCVNAHGPKEIGKPKPDYLVPPSKHANSSDY